MAAQDDVVAGIVAALRSSPARCGRVRLACIDGPAGAGKSTLAREIATQLGKAPIVHLDDLYQGWPQPLGPPLAARVEAWLLLAWASGLPGLHLRYDWGSEQYVGWVSVPPDPVVILEGCGSASAGIRRFAALVIWVEAPQAQCLARGLARDGAALADHWRAWQLAEQEHFTADGTRAAAGIVVDGTRPRAR